MCKAEGFNYISEAQFLGKASPGPGFYKIDH